MPLFPYFDLGALPGAAGVVFGLFPIQTDGAGLSEPSSIIRPAGLVALGLATIARWMTTRDVTKSLGFGTFGR